MKNKKSILKGRASAVFLIAVTAVVCVAFFILGIRRMQNIYSEQMYVTELETRKQSLSDSVNNFIATIDLKRSEADEYYTELMTQSETKAKEYAIAYGDYGEGLSNYFDSVALCDCFSYIIIDASTNQVLYAAGALSQVDYTGDVDALTEGLAYSTLIKNGNISCVYGISKEYVETKLLNELAGEIKVREYQDGEYLWIERIDNLEGGNDFATVLVHPGNPEIEGKTISTETLDEKDNAYNQAMLDGIKADGEVYTTYWYQEYQSDLISKKIVYSKWYEDYQWVISMGIPAHEIVEFVSETEKENQPAVYRMIALITTMFVVLFGLGMFFIVGNDRRLSLRTEKILRTEAHVDELTKANNRKFGNRFLEEKFEEYKKTGVSPAIMILDVDKFKGINDTYGHDAGDEVLKKVVRVMKKNMRATDTLIRWGGDEFVGVYDAVSKDGLYLLAEKIFESFEDLSISSKGQIVNATVSIGFTHFKPQDKSFKDAIKRADNGLYQSKSGGRNQFSILDE